MKTVRYFDEPEDRELLPSCMIDFMNHLRDYGKVLLPVAAAAGLGIVGFFVLSNYHPAYNNSQNSNQPLRELRTSHPTKSIDGKFGR